MLTDNYGNVVLPATQGTNPKGSTMSNFVPTDEQLAIQAAFDTKENVIVRALAGSGKTTVLKMLARSRPSTRMTYCAFNRAIADYAQKEFPSNTTCNTMHAFAFASVGQRYRHRMNGSRIPSYKVANILRIPERFEFGSFSLRSFQLVGLVNETIKRFCSSDVNELSSRFVPKVPGLDTPAACTALTEFLFPFVERAWEDLTSLTGQLRFDHAVYLKLWGMDNPLLPGKVILFDEAQDATPLTRSIVEKQDAQLIIVGDEFQQLYAWMGSIDALDYFDAPEKNQLPLSKSFRFGSAIADEANIILRLLGSSLEVRGHDPVPSSLAFLSDPEAVLCRTNAEAVARLLAAQAAGVSAGLVGGTAAVEALAKAALDLTSGRKTMHPELIAFENWSQVCEYVDSEDSDARDLQVLVRLVKRYGAQPILDAVQRAVPVAQAHLKLSTCHKAKGLEFNSVKLAGDFPPPFDDEGNPRKDELRLAYVAVTRAKHYLDTSIAGSSYADDDPHWDWLSAAAEDQGVDRVFMPALDVPERVALQSVERFQLECDPDDEKKLVFRATKYDPELVAAQRSLSRRRFHAEYNGDAKVNTCEATQAALAVAEQFKLSVAPDVLLRVEACDPAEEPIPGV